MPICDANVDLYESMTRTRILLWYGQSGEYVDAAHIYGSLYQLTTPPFVTTAFSLSDVVFARLMNGIHYATPSDIRRPGTYRTIHVTVPTTEHDAFCARYDGHECIIAWKTPPLISLSIPLAHIATIGKTLYADAQAGRLRMVSPKRIPFPVPSPKGFLS